MRDPKKNLAERPQPLPSEQIVHVGNWQEFMPESVLLQPLDEMVIALVAPMSSPAFGCTRPRSSLSDNYM